MDDQIIIETKQKMQKALQALRSDLASIRTGRAAPSLVENVIITAYSGTAKLKLLEMATIASLDNHTLQIFPFDPSQIKDVEKGIMAANLNLTPVVDGRNIRISIPMLTAERRKEYLKLAKLKLEGGRVTARQIRQEMMNKIKRLLETKEIGEDIGAHLIKKVQELTDEMMAEIEMMGEKKEAELMQV